MLDHDQKGIKTVRKRKVSDQIAGDLLKGAGAEGWDGKEGRLGWMCVDLVLLTRSAASDITANIRGKAQPPKLRGNTRMTSSGMVIMVGNDRMAKVGVSWDINLALVS